MFDLDAVLNDLRSAKDYAADALDEAQSAIGDLSAKLEEVDAARDGVVQEIRRAIDTFECLSCSIDEEQPDLSEVESDLSAIDGILSDAGQ